MPYINVKLNATKDEILKEKIVNLILDLTSTILNKKSEVTSVLVESVDENSWYINGKNENFFYLDIKVTKRTNTKDEKSKYINQMYKGFENLLEKIHEASYMYR